MATPELLMLILQVRLGSFESFIMCFGVGPHLLDLGDVLYAPNCFQDAQGRNIMLGWLQELRKGGGFDYAGCISLPRVLTYKGNHL